MAKSFIIKFRLNQSENEQEQRAIFTSALRFINSLSTSAALHNPIAAQLVGKDFKITLSESGEHFVLQLAPIEELNVPELRDDCTRINAAIALNCYIWGELSDDNKWLFLTIVPPSDAISLALESIYNCLSTDVQSVEISCKLPQN